jgi:hypothetical protein
LQKITAATATDLGKISDKLVKQLLLYWWYESGDGIQKLQEKLHQYRNDAFIFRIDGTYKIVKHLGYYENGVWIPFRAVLNSTLDQVPFDLSFLS